MGSTQLAFWGAGRECNLSRVRASLTSHRHSQQSTPGVHAWDEGEECEEDSLGGGCLLGVELECSSRKEATAEHAESRRRNLGIHLRFFAVFDLFVSREKKGSQPRRQKVHPKTRERRLHCACSAKLEVPTPKIPSANSWPSFSVPSSACSSQKDQRVHPIWWCRRC